MDLEWSTRRPLAADAMGDVAAGAGLYLIADAASHEILDIGQSASIAKRLTELAGRDWGARQLEFSYQVVGESVLPHNLRELECDLLGNYYEQNRKAPEFRFRSTQ
jgi:hypothetical protein